RSPEQRRLTAVVLVLRVGSPREACLRDLHETRARRPDERVLAERVRRVHVRPSAEQRKCACLRLRFTRLDERRIACWRPLPLALYSARVDIGTLLEKLRHAPRVVAPHRLEQSARIDAHGSRDAARLRTLLGLCESTNPGMRNRP